MIQHNLITTDVNHVLKVLVAMMLQDGALGWTGRVLHHQAHPELNRVIKGIKLQCKNGWLFL